MRHLFTMVSTGKQTPQPEYYNEDERLREVHRENATFFSLVENERLDGMLSSIQQVEDRFNHNYNYDWVFMNDKPFTDLFKTNVASTVSGRAIFIQIPEEFWGVPSRIDKLRMERAMNYLNREGVLYAKKLSYRQMCRFNSGFFYKMPIMDKYQYYWRVEPSIRFDCDIPYDPFELMRKENYTYGFSMALLEDRKSIRKLWTTSMEFFDTEHPEHVNKDNSLKFINHNSEAEEYEPGYYNLCHYWSNFEIANLDFFRSRQYEDYF
ncbi:DEKNAAC104659, partial [Brettanomyces naardenensis]